jgi:hypothetical protein
MYRLREKVKTSTVYIGLRKKIGWVTLRKFLTKLHKERGYTIYDTVFSISGYDRDNPSRILVKGMFKKDKKIYDAKILWQNMSSVSAVKQQYEVIYLEIGDEIIQT